jgi:2-keto-4-pentenoate hydratase
MAAERLRRAHDTRQPCAPVRDLIGADDITSAYAVQEENTRSWLAEGRRIVGRKIGLTSLAVQKQLGVDQPDFGMLSASPTPLPITRPAAASCLARATCGYLTWILSIARW